VNAADSTNASAKAAAVTSQAELPASKTMDVASALKSVLSPRLPFPVLRQMPSGFRADPAIEQLLQRAKRPTSPQIPMI